MSGLESLPDEVAKLVMQHVPLKDRLTSCCLVSSRLHAAAMAATQELKLSFGTHVGRGLVSPDQSDSVLEWLSHYGQHLNRLDLSWFPQPLRQLSCPNLLELELDEECKVQLGPAPDGSQGVVHGCPKLTSLELSCDILDIRDIDNSNITRLLDGCLSILVDLQHLSIHPVGNPAVWGNIDGLSDMTLPSLAHLTHLNVRDLSKKNLAQLGGFSNLQELALTAAYGDFIGPGCVPGLAFPASLTSLWTYDQGMESELLSLLPVGLKHLCIHGRVTGPTSGPGSLLAGFARLQQLVFLDVCIGGWPPAGPAYSALTASSCLEWLRLAWVSCLPAAVWPHVFPAARTLPHLTCLQFPDGGYGRPPGVPSAFGAVDMESLVRCCPKLCWLDGVSMQHGLHVSELHKLTDLTQLNIRYSHDDLAITLSSLKGLAAVTQLKALDVSLIDKDLSVGSLLPLTSLTALTYLHCIAEGCKYPYYVLAYLSHKAGSSAPDVWLQLLERCVAEPDCQPTTLRSLAQQLAEQRVVVTQQQQQLSDQQQRVVAQEQLAAMQQQHIANLQEQFAAQQHAASQQAALNQALVAGMWEQLQELRAEVQELRQHRQQ